MITPITTNSSVTKISNVCVVSIVTFDTMLPWSIKSPTTFWPPYLRWLRRLQMFLWVPLQAQLQWLPVVIACYVYTNVPLVFCTVDILYICLSFPICLPALV